MDNSMETNEHFIPSNNFSLLINQQTEDEKDRLIPPIMNPLLSYLNSEESQQIVCFDGYYYILTRANDKRVYYKCRNNLCTGRGVSISGSFTCIKFHKPGCTPQALMCDNSMANINNNESEQYSLANGGDNFSMEISQYDVKPDVQSLLNGFTQIETQDYKHNLKEYVKNLKLPEDVSLTENTWQPVVVLDSIPVTHLSCLQDMKSEIKEIGSGVQFITSNRGKRVLCHQNKQYVLIRCNVDGSTGYYRCRSQPCGAKGICKANDKFELTIPHGPNCKSGKTGRSTYIRSRGREWTIQDGRRFSRRGQNAYYECQNLPEVCRARGVFANDTTFRLTQEHADQCPVSQDVEGFDTLCFDGWQYALHRQNLTGTLRYYSCLNSNCPARAILKGQNFTLTSDHGPTCPRTQGVGDYWSEGAEDLRPRRTDEGPEIDLTKMLEDTGQLTQPTTNIRFIRSNKGRAVLCHGNYQFTQHHRNYKGHTFYYKCRNKDCPARGILKGKTFIPTKEHDRDCHVPKPKHLPFQGGEDSTTLATDQTTADPTGAAMLEFAASPDGGETVTRYGGVSYRQSNVCANKVFYECQDPGCSGRAVLTFRPIRSHSRDCGEVHFASSHAVMNEGSTGYTSVTNPLDLGTPDPGHFQTVPPAADHPNGSLRSTTHHMFDSIVNGSDYPAGTEPVPGSGATSSHLATAEQTTITYIASSNGKPMAFYHGFLYINDRNYNDHMYYRCHRAPLCPGRGKISGTTFQLTQMHNHAIDVNKYMGLETRNKLKEAVLSNPCQSLKKTYDQVMHQRKLEVENIEMYPYALPRYKTVQRSMGKLLNKIRLAFPNYRDMFYT